MEKRKSPTGKALSAGLIISLMLVQSGLLQGQPVKRVDHGLHSWFVYSGNHRVSAALKLLPEVQLRRSSFLQTPQQLLFRTALEYSAGKNTGLAAGYAFVETFPYGEQPVARPFVEHRLFEQFQLASANGSTAFQHRYRLEQRWLENTGVDNNSWRYLNRMRYRLLFMLSLNKPLAEKGAWFLAASDEVFVSWGPTAGLNLLDQNRFYAGIGYQVLPKLSLQLGYLNQLLMKSDGVRIENNHTVQLMLSSTFALFKSSSGPM